MESVEIVLEQPEIFNKEQFKIVLKEELSKVSPEYWKKLKRCNKKQRPPNKLNSKPK